MRKRSGSRSVAAVGYVVPPGAISVLATPVLLTLLLSQVNPDLGGTGQPQTPTTTIVTSSARAGLAAPRTSEKKEHESVARPGLSIEELEGSSSAQLRDFENFLRQTHEAGTGRARNNDPRAHGW
mmetsp:Transcript_17088/g.35572  ORF Transcript_17088/g.35572 Transcript_17088/m.35572 type:complete len:125 (-) Transcript_17088:752-1126(-)